MVEIFIVYYLSDGYVVYYNGALYVLMDQDILFQDSKAYTYPNKLVASYR